MNKLFSFKLCFGMMALSLLVACDQLGSELQEVLGSEAEEVNFLNGSFSVIKPASWSKMDDLNNEADLQMGNYSKEAYAVILTESKLDFDEITMQGHSDLTRVFLEESLENYQASEPEVINVGNFQALRYRLSGSFDGIKIVYWHVTLETKDHFHQVLLWSLPSKFSDNEADFNSVIQSFKVIKQ